MRDVKARAGNIPGTQECRKKIKRLVTWACINYGHAIFSIIVIISVLYFSYRSTQLSTPEQQSGININMQCQYKDHPHHHPFFIFNIFISKSDFCYQYHYHYQCQYHLILTRSLFHFRGSVMRLFIFYLLNHSWFLVATQYTRNQCWTTGMIFLYKRSA